MGNVFWTIAICCGIPIFVKFYSTIGMLTDSKIPFVTIVDFINALLIMLQDPLVWILSIIAIICVPIASKF